MMMKIVSSIFFWQGRTLSWRVRFWWDVSPWKLRNKFVEIRNIHYSKFSLFSSGNCVSGRTNMPKVGSRSIVNHKEIFNYFIIQSAKFFLTAFRESNRLSKLDPIAHVHLLTSLFFCANEEIFEDIKSGNNGKIYESKKKASIVCADKMRMWLSIKPEIMVWKQSDFMHLNMLSITELLFGSRRIIEHETSSLIGCHVVAVVFFYRHSLFRLWNWNFFSFAELSGGQLAVLVEHSAHSGNEIA